MDTDIKTLLEFMRIKAPELNIRQNQLARIIFLFFVLSIFLFLTITDGIGSVSLRLKDPVSISDLIIISEPRVFIVLGATVIVFFYFVRFGYLYLQSVKEVASTHNVIDAALPYGQDKQDIREAKQGLHEAKQDLREALTQTCRSNYIVQSIVVFLYSPKAVNHNEYLITEGPLSGSSAWRGMFIKFVMILTTIAVEWVIAVSQFLMLVVFLAFTKWFFSLLLVFAFFLYYLFYFEYVVRKARELKEGWITTVAGVGALLIVISMTANLWVLTSYEYSPNVFTCRMSIDKIREISPPAALLVAFLFKERTDLEKAKVEMARKVNDEIPLCPPGKNP